MDLIAATNQCGFDCYLSQDGGTPRYYATTRIHDITKDSYEAVVVSLPVPKELEVIIHFPLYAGVCQVLLGFDEGVRLSAPRPRKDDRRVVIYGTSITQGASASRPGAALTNILSRKLNREVINLGFDSSGKCEAEAALAIRDVERTGMLILDNNPNCPDGQWIAEKYPTFLRLYRERYPKVPILVLSRCHFARDLLLEDQLRNRIDMRNATEQAVKDRVQAGDEHIYFLDGAAIFDPEEFEEYTVDGTHATDLGFYKMAQKLLPILSEYLD